ncbi:MAG: hypothetical protein J0H53_22965 [Rhizobiales bacterium]|mgnify:CR=1 FL=1|nr:hypothetical protein [Hyphomicrobiales bacterium]OJU36223.1 MAG: hypothetical protein BGN94_13210 [Rhizobiales bacterium 68-8]
MRFPYSRHVVGAALCLAILCAGLTLWPAGARASHCPALSAGFSQMKKMRAAVDAADARGDTEGACRLQKQLVAYEKKLLGSTRTACFHGGKPAFETAVKASEALVDLYCDWDEDEDF